MNGRLFFYADDGINGRELWTSDGTSEGTKLFKDIRPGAAASEPRSLTNFNGILYFSANDGVHGQELWRSDGTAEGTYQLPDIAAGSASSTPNSILPLGNTIIFAANDGIHGNELWTLAEVNQAPQAVNDFAEVGYDNTLEIAASLGLLANDTDVDSNDTKTVAAVNGVAANVGTEIVLESGAKLLVHADGSYQYDPNGKFASLGEGQSATETFTYAVADGAGATSLGTVTIRILGPNIHLKAVAENGEHTAPGFAQQLFVGLPPGGDSNLVFEALADGINLFAEQPQIDSAGTLTFKPAANSQGIAVVTVIKKHVVASAPPQDEETAEFVIELVQQAPWQNDVDSNDVNNDGDVVAEDVLLVINFINAVGSGAITNASAPTRFYDTDGDNSISASDVLKIINLINAGGDAQEGEAKSVLGAASVDKLWGEADLDWYWSDLNQVKITGKQRRT